MNHSSEAAREERFAFGRNWSLFLSSVNDEIIQDAQRSLLAALRRDDLEGLSFLDIGSGSGLSSLVARRSGARVHSIDIDPQCVACTRELKRRYFPDDENWTIAEGSILDENLAVDPHGYDIVYSWGVLHHTGQMWRAIETTLGLMAENGRLFIAIYNDQGRASRLWTRIKRLYNRLPGPLRFLIVLPAAIRIWGPTTVRDILRGRPFHTWRSYPRHNRGMHPWRDLIDWVGGYPFEVATPQQVIDFCEERHLSPTYVKTCGTGRGCNEFVFDRNPDPGTVRVQP